MALKVPSQLFETSSDVKWMYYTDSQMGPPTTTCFQSWLHGDEGMHKAWQMNAKPNHMMYSTGSRCTVQNTLVDLSMATPKTVGYKLQLQTRDSQSYTASRRSDAQDWRLPLTTTKMPLASNAELIELVERLTILLQRLVEILNEEVDRMDRDRLVVLTD